MGNVVVFAISLNRAYWREAFFGRREAYAEVANMVNIEMLPSFIRARLEGRDTIRKAFGNSFWLFCDQILRMAAGLIVGIWMARYLGPENYGWLNYAIAVVGIVSAFTGLGINTIVVRELVKTPAETHAWLGTALLVRGVGAAVGFVACVGIASMQSAPSDSLILIVAAGIIFQLPDVVDLLFQARGEAQVSAWVRMFACILATVLKLALIFARAPLWTFAVAGVAEIVVAAAGWWWTGSRRGVGMNLWYTERRRAKVLLHESWPLAMSGLAISAQAYADQLVLGALMGGGELGQYAAAIRVVSVFAFVPMVLQTVAAPEITRAKQDDEVLYRRRLHGLYRIMLGIFLLTAIPLVVLGPSATRWLYGMPYQEAAALLPWLALRLFFTNFGVARSVFVANEGLFRFGLVTALVGAVVNISLNLWLVPTWGARGAIAASLMSFGVTIFVLDIFQPRARVNLLLMTRAIAMPWRKFAV